MKKYRTAGGRYGTTRRGVYVTNVEVRWEHLLQHVRALAYFYHTCNCIIVNSKWPVKIFEIMVTGVFCQKDDRMNSKCLNTAFPEYVQWLRLKYLLYRYEVVDNTLLLEYEQQLIALLNEEVENEFFWIEKCT